MTSRIKALAAGAMVLALAACATPQTQSLRDDPGDLPRMADVPDAPFYAQKTRECGPAALAMALSATGLDVTPDDLVEAVYTPEREGTLAPDMITAARRHGRLAYPVKDMRGLFREVASGRPVVVMQNLGLSWAPRWHFAEVVGYDIEGDTVVLHSGKTERMTMDMNTFELTWDRAEYWGIVVLRPGDLPRHPDRVRYLAAAAGLEQAGRLEDARKAYAAGLAAWPGDLGLRMALGNVLYALERKQAAAEAFARAAADHPDAGDALNNLAHVRLELGDLTVAETAAEKAVAIGGPRAATYRETLAAVRAAKSEQASR